MQWLNLGRTWSLPRNHGFHGTSSHTSLTGPFFVCDGFSLWSLWFCLAAAWAWVASHHMGPCFPTRKEPCPLHWQAGSSHLDRQGIPSPVLNSARLPEWNSPAHLFSPSKSTFFSSFPHSFLWKPLTLLCLLNTPRYKAQFLACLHPVSSSPVSSRREASSSN